ncbi:MAG TPA: O-antigen ligase family protein [Longimicrobium sp.]
MPKSLIFQASVLLAACVLLLGQRTIRLDMLDACVAAVVILGILSAVLNAENRWWAFRGLGLGMSVALAFTTARTVSGAGHGRRLRAGIVVGATLVAGTALLEAYGVLPFLSLPGRAPGGSMGNRNEMAHLLVVALPTAIWYAWTARARLSWSLVAVFLLVWAVTLSRTRAAWLALLVAIVCYGALRVLQRRSTTLPMAPTRTAWVVCACAAAVMTAAVLPNDLSWRSSTPFADSARSLADYETGSGRGRTIQYAATLRMIAGQPILGVGPGNWPVRYPEYAHPGDPSYRPERVFPTNRVPHSDWLGIAAEWGGLAGALLVVAAVLLIRQAGRVVPGESAREAPAYRTSVISLACVLVVGALNPVVLLPAGGFMAALVLGASAPRDPLALTIQVTRWRKYAAASALLLVCGPSVVYAANQLRASSRYSFNYSIESLTEAVTLNPGDYYAQLLLAQAWVRSERCDRARPHAAAAQSLLPGARAPARVWARCARRGEPGTGMGPARARVRE